MLEEHRQFRRHVLQSMGADDRTKRDGFHTLQGKEFMAAKVRQEELWAKVVVIEGRKDWSHLVYSESHMSKMRH